MVHCVSYAHTHMHTHTPTHPHAYAHVHTVVVLTRDGRVVSWIGSGPVAMDGTYLRTLELCVRT